jgi:GDP-mannose 6-dehydrogenase
MDVSIFGLGYVGSVTAACLAEQGHNVIGVEVNPAKVQWINEGKTPVLEAQLDTLIERAVRAGRLSATTNVMQAIERSELSLICVGTPSKANGDLDLQYVCRVTEQIGEALSRKSENHTVVLRSTVLPGTTWNVVKPILESRSDRQVGENLRLFFNPEFLREGSAVADFYNPPFTLVGACREVNAEIIKNLYTGIQAEFIVSEINLAEAVKYVNNCYHALKVTFANEVGRLCRAMGVDSHALMEIFCKDKKQNLSSYYLKPGFAFGGSCLPKDLRAILYKAKSLDVPMEVFSAVLDSNRTQIEIGIEMVERLENKRVGLLGLSFKHGTDDLRESPLVVLAETLHGRGYTVKIFDEHVCLSRIIGANKAYIEQKLPHIGALLSNSAERVIEESETIVIGNGNPRFQELVAKIAPEKAIVDLVRINQARHGVLNNYYGIGW